MHMPIIFLSKKKNRREKIEEASVDGKKVLK
jgi:hypothetical protein